MTYVMGFVIAVPTGNKEAYREMAEAAAVVFKKHGALSVVEAWGADVPEGKLTSFPMAVKLEPGETVVFSWIVWPSKEVLETGNMAAMNEFEETGLMASHLFDGKRMIFGGFETIVEA